jgi:DNA-binding MarR family transcriptional regulator
LSFNNYHDAVTEAKSSPVAGGGAVPAGSRLTSGDTAGDAEIVEQASLTLFELTLKALSSSRQLSMLQLRVLLAVEQHGPVNLGDVADQLDLSRPSASRLVTRLVDEGLILRRTPDADRRQVQLAVSAKGRRMLDSLRRGRQREISGVLEAMPRDGREAPIHGLMSFAAAATETLDPAVRR